jgi:nickel-dependent lactate racemase
MRASIAFGQQTLDLEINERNLVVGRRALMAPNLADPVQAMRDALEHPLDYPALRLALTPDDHVAIVVDEGIPHLATLLVPLLEHIRQAHVQPEAVTLICPPPSSEQAWLDELPDDFQDVKIEVHQPNDRKKLAYLATTTSDRRVYLNRTAVDADQLILLTRRRYDPRVGYAGAELDLYPGLCGEATAAEIRAELDNEGTETEPSALQAEAREVSWLLGAPFFVQVIEGDGAGFAHILAGPRESSAAGERSLDARWRVEFDQLADVVFASITGGSAQQSVDDLARAFFAASHIVKPGGSIVLLSEISPTLGPEFTLIREHDDPSLLPPLLADHGAAYLWATAANQARLYLLSGLANELAEELFTIPLQNAEQARKLLTERTTVALLPDAHKTLTVQP